MKIDRRKVYDKYDGHCAYCGQAIEFKNMQVDHLHPKWLKHWHESDIDEYNNLMPSCRRCNHYKRGDLLKQYRSKMKTLHERLMQIYIVKVAVDFGIIKIEPFDGMFYFEKYYPPKTEGGEG